MGRFYCRRIAFLIVLPLLLGCRSVRQAEPPAGAHFRVLTYNVNWGVPDPDTAIELIRHSNADIVCLQETTPEWAHLLRTALADPYPFMEFRQSPGRMGGGLAFLSKVAASEVAYLPSETGWFDGWIKSFQTPLGPVQILNVHLQPPVGKSGSFNACGYLFTSDDRLKEIERFYPARLPAVPMLVVGDFNDAEGSPVVEWLKNQGYNSALSQFDRRTPTWQWRAGPLTLRRRMDHILFPNELHCCAAEVIRAGSSDHFPVSATLEKKPLPSDKRP
jgi:endonuclease/exonuclease/phosphatase family metal-dependent hydrolase